MSTPINGISGTLGTGLMHRWNFDNNIIDDVNSTVLTGTPVYEESKRVAFTGQVSQALHKTVYLFNANNFTMSGFFKWNTEYKYFFSLGLTNILTIASTGTPNELWFRFNGNSRYISGVTDGVQHHIIVKVLGTSATIVIDGITLDTLSITAINSTENKVIFGDYWDIEFFPFTGAIDEVRIYNRQTTPEEDAELLLMGTDYILPQCATPVSDVPSGTYQNDLEVILNCSTEDVEIRYTTDGTEPNETSTIFIFEIPITVNTNLKAKAFKEGYASSETLLVEILIECNTPIVNPTSIEFEDSLEIEMSCGYPNDAVIRYSIDGGETFLYYIEPFTITDTTTILAYAELEGFEDSENNTQTYTKITKCAAPTILPATGSHYNNVLVTMESETSETEIRYTTDGSEPSETSNLYSNPVLLNNTTTIKAKAFKPGYDASETTQKVYTIIKSQGGIKMGMPKINIAFQQKIAKAIGRGSSGIVAIILKDASATTELKEYKMNLITEIPDTLSAGNKSLLTLIFLGTPRQVKAIVIPEDSETIDVEAALDYLEISKFNILCAPDASTEEIATIASWIKSVRGEDINKKVMAVLFDIAVSDSEGLINFTTTVIKTSDTTFTGKQYTARIAGLIAGQVLTIAPTFAVIQEAVDITPRPIKADADAAIDAGELILVHDGTKVKIGRGVTSFVTTTTEKGEDWKKIKIVRICDLVSEDMKTVIADEYQGKVNNTYMNKLLLLSAINSYLESLAKSEILDPEEDNSAEIDIEEQRLYLQSIGIDTSEMSEQDIKEANTKDNLFFALHIKPTDAMEDFNLKVYI